MTREVTIAGNQVQVSLHLAIVDAEYDVPRSVFVSEAKVKEVFQRHPNNPILTATDWPYTVNSVFNPGATIFQGTSRNLCEIGKKKHRRRIFTSANVA